MPDYHRSVDKLPDLTHRFFIPILMGQFVKLLAITQISEHKRIPGFGKVVEPALKLAEVRGFLEPIIGLLSFSDRGGQSHHG